MAIPNPRPGKLERIQVIDSHTGGEPTRTVLGGGPDLGGGSVADQCELFRTKFDRFRSAVVNEPRGSDVVVGALLCEPNDTSCVAGVIFFNNVSTLGMCGHGTIGVAVTLARLGKILPGRHAIETSVGRVEFELHADAHTVTLTNVPCYRHAKDVEITVAGKGRIVGDVAWGGNWFYLIAEHGEEIRPDRVHELSRFTADVRRALEADGITGARGGLIDHIELFGPPTVADADSKNFVYCPGGAYDRSPCGTGTSAKLACLAADGSLRPGETWRQESIIGSLFSGVYQESGDGEIIPSITGSAWVTADATLLLDPDDPFKDGIRT